MDTLTQELYTRPRRRTRARLTPATPDQPLNEQETAILRLIAAGHTYDQIGRQRYMAPDTVKWYAKRIYLKLGARGAANAVHIAHTRGILTRRAA